MIADWRNICGESYTGKRDKTRYEQFHEINLPLSSCYLSVRR